MQHQRERKKRERRKEKTLILSNTTTINSDHRKNWFSQLHKKVVNRSKKGIFSSGMAQVSLKGEINLCKT